MGEEEVDRGRVSLFPRRAGGHICRATQGTAGGGTYSSSVSRRPSTRKNNATRMYGNGLTPCQLHMRLQGLIFIKATRDNILAATGLRP